MAGEAEKAKLAAAREVEQQQRDPISMKLDALLDKSKLGKTGDEAREAMKKGLLDSLVKTLGGNLPEIAITSGFDKENIRKILQLQLQGPAMAAFPENADQAMAFANASAFALTDALDTKFLKPIAAKGGDISKLVGVCKIDIKIVDDSVELVMGFDDAMKAALEGIYAMDQAEVAPPVDEALNRAKTKVQYLAAAIADDAPTMAGVAEALKGDHYYVDLEGKFNNAIGRIVDFTALKMNVKFNPLLDELGTDGKLSRADFEKEKYAEALKAVLREKAMKDVDTSIVAGGKDLALVKSFKPGPQGAGPVFQLAFESGKFKVVFPADFDTKAKEVVQKGNPEYEQRQRNIAEAQSGVIGWFLTSVMGFKKEDWEAVADGKHPICYLLGAIGVASGGASYAWAQDKWKGAKEKAAKNPKTASLAASFEAAANKLASFAGGGAEDLTKKAAPKGAQELAAILENGKGNYVAVEAENGISLTENYALKDGESLNLKLSKGEIVTFGAKINFEKNGVPMEASTMTAQEDMTLALKTTLPKGTFLSKGVQLQHIKNSPEQAVA